MLIDNVNSLPLPRKLPAPPGTPPIKTQKRSATILPNFVGLKFQVHNGKIYQDVVITEEMVGRKLGEFVAWVFFFSLPSLFSFSLVIAGMGWGGIWKVGEVGRLGCQKEEWEVLEEWEIRLACDDDDDDGITANWIVSIGLERDSRTSSRRTNDCFSGCVWLSGYVAILLCALLGILPRPLWYGDR